MARPEGLAPRAVLWDLDGTLADSSVHHWRSWQAVLADEGVGITEVDFRATFGQRNEEILRRWLGPDTDADRIRRVGEAKERVYRALVRAEGLAPLPGAAEWIRHLHEEGWRQAIASSAPRENIEVMHTALSLEGLIDTTVGAEDVLTGKPDPEVFQVAATRLEVPPSRCVVVEDAEAGIEAARRAGMASIGVGREAGARADTAVEALTELVPGAFDALVEG
ncbi:MAG: HAD family phosphatase [Gemmatimonadota bacterium]|jgi:beta-phosphoglucomutase